MQTIDGLLGSADGLLKVFIASRNDTDLAEHYRHGYHVEVCCNDKSDDIQRFVASKLQQNTWCQRHILKNVRDRVLETFKRKSQGMFQWAALHIEELLDLRDNVDIQTYVDALPDDLKSAYDRVWQTIQTKRGRASVIFQRAFQQLMVSWMPLSPELLKLTVCQDPAADFCPNVDITIEYILDACHNLIKLDRTESRSGGDQH
ncbi:hypothetical protein GE09DRAFT_373662 [Coniochaeta sp. 2T2.1]|nr:hypothetical protein GE09DRAFT_373662 [Coniochaeta sp. 2T2.1]